MALMYVLAAAVSISADADTTACLDANALGLPPGLAAAMSEKNAPLTSAEHCARRSPNGSLVATPKSGAATPMYSCEVQKLEKFDAYVCVNGSLARTDTADVWALDAAGKFLGVQSGGAFELPRATGLFSAVPDAVKLVREDTSGGGSKELEDYLTVIDGGLQLVLTLPRGGVVPNTFSETAEDCAKAADAVGGKLAKPARKKCDEALKKLKAKGGAQMVQLVERCVAKLPKNAPKKPPKPFAATCVSAFENADTNAVDTDKPVPLAVVGKRAIKYKWDKKKKVYAGK